MKTFLINFFSSKITFFLAATLLILSLNLTPLILQLRHSPPGRTFALIHNNVQDFFFYQALMNEGANGQWLTSDPYTSETHQPSIIFAYLLWLGKLSKLLGLPYALTYHLTRIILGIFFLFSIFYFLFSIRLPYPRLAFFFFLFAAPFLHKAKYGGNIGWLPYMNWWTGMDPVRRIAYLPHHLFGSLFLVVTIFFLIKYFYKQKTKYLAILILSSLLLAFVHTPSLFIILLTLPPAIGIYYLINNLSEAQRISKAKPKETISECELPKKTVDQVKIGHFAQNYQNQNKTRATEKFVSEDLQKSGKLIRLLVYWLLGLFFLFLMLFQTQRGFPWSQYIAWEKNLQFPLAGELWGAFGILLPFSAIGIVKALLSKRFEYILVASWFVSPLLLIPFAPMLNISNIRLIQGAPYLPLAILAVLGIEFINSKFKIQYDYFAKHSKIFADRIRNFMPTRKFNNKKYVTEKDYQTMPSTALISCEQENFVCKQRRAVLNCWVIGLLFVIFTLPTLSWSIKDQIREYWPVYSNVYLDNRLNQAFAFINQYFPERKVALATFYTGNYLPAFTNTVSYIGHSGYTYNLEKKEVEVTKFFGNKMAPKEAKEFILNNKIALVFQGSEEKPLSNNYLYPTLLEPVYDREGVTLYVPLK